MIYPQSECAASGIDEGWMLWGKGNFSGAEKVADEILESEPASYEALRLKINLLYIRGMYREAIELFSKLDNSYENYNKVRLLIGEAFLHLNRPKNAYEMFSGVDSIKAAIAKDMTAKPFSLKGDKTYVIPFLDSVKLAENMPAIYADLNGKPITLRMDTGGTFLVMGPEDAKKFGLQKGIVNEGMHATNKVKVWHSTAEKLELADGLIFHNVPVKIVESLKGFIIMGTNILEQFLCTIDYPNSRYILTPRTRKDLYGEHLAMLKSERTEMPFYLWGDHFMICKGGYDSFDSLNYFMDSGLIAFGMNKKGEPEQAGLNVSKETLLKWEYSDEELKETAVLNKDNTVRLGGLAQDNIIIYFDPKLEKDRVFGGINIDALLSHGFLNKYSWTIDFDNNKYIFTN